jgi:hypothetical protein
MREGNPFGMSDEEFAAIKERAQAEMDHVKANAFGDEMPCPSCSQSVRLRWDQDHLSWDAQCLCGWAAAGSGPQGRTN